MAGRAWERLGNQTVELDLKVGSWYEACAQAFVKDPRNVLFLFPGRRDLRALQQSGLKEPPAETIFAEIGHTDSAFMVVTPDGWLPLERRETQLLALACAALSRLVAAGDEASAASGDLTLPGGVRGRYRVRLAPPHPDANQLVPVFGIAREDLYEGESMLSMVNVGWADYEGLRTRPRDYLPSPFLGRVAVGASTASGCAGRAGSPSREAWSSLMLPDDGDPSVWTSSIFH